MYFKLASILVICSLILFDDALAGSYYRRHRRSRRSSSRRRCRDCIPGPRRYRDNIAIVGAGAAGVHMAYLLKKKGFKDITILEKSSRAGGKSLSINRRGAAQELGTCYLSPDYEQNIIELVDKFMTGGKREQLVILEQASIWLDGLPPITHAQYIGMESLRNFGTRNVTIATAKLVQAIRNYISEHERLFGSYVGELMPQPNRTVMHEIRGTFMDFLKRKGLTSLHPLFLASHTMQGYGHVDEVAALYGLLWNTPKMMRGLLKRLMKQDDTGLYLLKNGFQRLWEAMIRKENLHVEYNVDVKHVYRSRRRRGSWLCTSHNRECHFYRFVIWTPELGQSLDKFHPAHDEERDIFERMEAAYYSTSLIDTENVKKGPTPIDYMFSNVLKKIENSVWAQRDSYAALRRFKGPAYQNNSLPSGNDGKKTRTVVGYQYGKSRPNEQELRRIMTTKLRSMNGTKIDIKFVKPWRYFPRFNPEDVNAGIIWDIVKMQGKYGMWYAGSSVIFESVKSVVEYNELLVRKMKPPCN